MSRDDRSRKDATNKPPYRGGSSFLRSGSSPSLAIILVAGLVGCKEYESAFGSLHFEGSDQMGPFSGEVKASTCLGRFEQGGGTSVSFGGTGHIILVDGGLRVDISTHGGGGWTVDRSTCRGFDVRKWFDAEKHLHVVVVLDGCTDRDGTRVQGRVRSDACEILRPY